MSTHILQIDFRHQLDLEIPRGCCVNHTILFLPQCIWLGGQVENRKTKSRNMLGQASALLSTLKNVRRTEYPALSSKSELWSNIYSQIRKSSVAANAFRHINQARSEKKKTVQSVAVSVSSTFRLRGIGAREYTWKKIWAGIVE